MHVALLPDRCAGHARCHAHNSDLYPLDDEGFVLLPAVPEGRLVPAELQDQARAGARACPEGAIQLEE
jgi:ferredoxin